MASLAALALVCIVCLTALFDICDAGIPCKTHPRTQKSTCSDSTCLSSPVVCPRHGLRLHLRDNESMLMPKQVAAMAADNQ